MSKTLNIQECADLLKIHCATVQVMAAAGELPGAKVGRAWVFLEEDLLAFLRAKVDAQVARRQYNSPINRLMRQQQAEHAPTTSSAPPVQSPSSVPPTQRKWSKRRVPIS